MSPRNRTAMPRGILFLPSLRSFMPSNSSICSAPWYYAPFIGPRQPHCRHLRRHGRLAPYSILIHHPVLRFLDLVLPLSPEVMDHDAREDDNEDRRKTKIEPLLRRHGLPGLLAQPRKIRHDGVHLGLAPERADVFGCERIAEHLHFLFRVSCVKRAVREPGIGRHVGIFIHALRLLHMHSVPRGRILRAYVGKVRPGALRPPEMGPVNGRVLELRIGSVPVRFELQGTHGLRMAVVAALANVDVASLKLDRLVRGHLLKGRGWRSHKKRKKGRDQRPSEYRRNRQYDEDNRIFIDVHGRLLWTAAWGKAHGA